MTSSESYFAATLSGKNHDEPGSFVQSADLPLVELAPGVTSRAIVGSSCMISQVYLAPHSTAPVHAHSEEQLVLVLEGLLYFTLGSETKKLGPGDAVLVPPHVPHGAYTEEHGCREIDIFAPPRQALLDALGKERDCDESRH